MQRAPVSRPLKQIGFNVKLTHSCVSISSRNFLLLVDRRWVSLNIKSSPQKGQEIRWRWSFEESECWQREKKTSTSLFVLITNEDKCLPLDELEHTLFAIQLSDPIKWIKSKFASQAQNTGYIACRTSSNIPRSYIILPINVPIHYMYNISFHLEHPLHWNLNYICIYIHCRSHKLHFGPQKVIPDKILFFKKYVLGSV